jgi:uncharacterized membrane protein YfcA
MEFTLELLIAAPLIIAGAYCVFGMTGFGSAIIALPLLTHLLPFKFVLPMYALLDVTASLTTGIRFHADIARRELAFLLPCLLAGMAAGVFLLIELPAEWILLALGIFVFSYGIYAVSEPETTWRLSRVWAIPVGLIGGAISALFGTGGPLYVTYLTARGLTAGQIRSSTATIFAITATTRIVLFAASGLYGQQGIFISALGLAPAMLIGLYAGHRLHVNLPRRRIVQVIGGLLVLSGGSLIVRAW